MNVEESQRQAGHVASISNLRPTAVELSAYGAHLKCRRRERYLFVLRKGFVRRRTWLFPASLALTCSLLTADESFRFSLGPDGLNTAPLQSAQPRHSLRGDRSINALEFDIVKKIVGAPDDNVTGARLRCLAYTGMRPIQLERLQRHHIDLNNATVWVPVGKGGKTELIHLPKAGVQAFKDLIRFADSDTLHARFKYKWGGPIDGRNRRMTLRRAAKKAGYVGPITTYWLRHSLATHMLDQGASTRQIQQQLTHSSLDLIERYTKVENSKGLTSVMDRIA